MKNIAFVIHSLGSGGAERVVTTLANNLSHTYKVTIVTFIKSEPFYELNNNVRVQHCITDIEPSQNVFQSIRLNFKLYRRICQLAQEHSFDLLIGFMTQSNVLTVLCGKKIGVTTIISERNNPQLDITPKFWKALRRITYPWTDKLVVQTKPIADFYRPYIPKKKIEVIQNPIARSYTDHLRYAQKTSRENVILHVGRLCDQKGQEIAIKAFAELKLDNWELLLLGEGPKRKSYEELIAKLGLKDKIKLLGRMKNVSDYYLKSSIFVFPSRYEGFPNALTEAMYMGLPSISSDCPTGPSELIQNGQNGFLIPLDDISELHEKMAKLISDNQLRQELGENAHLSVKHLEEDNISNLWKGIIADSLK
ncbi:glycosyltransferase family 4 protein [Muricauda sp. 334s03]|uniref:Glycosyltransferase family 4 protein n=1 Tax=Flagellimonas yonaguniensis TaxID=3031325 RepID=A0ABT5Y263_9FLAO|nr:glycosyltransferase family 4 protein [[Muricauda] yonaguniensis]MDF0717419.1 glycosyltransferase family 4 protein [[Muricauda] yonaguniensis]